MRLESNPTSQQSRRPINHNLPRISVCRYHQNRVTNKEWVEGASIHATISSKKNPGRPEQRRLQMAALTSSCVTTDNSERNEKSHRPIITQFRWVVSFLLRRSFKITRERRAKEDSRPELEEPSIDGYSLRYVQPTSLFADQSGQESRYRVSVPFV